MINTLTEEKINFHKLLHEIKNPLTVCSGYLEIMDKNRVNPKYLEIIKSEINECISLVTNYRKNETLKETILVNKLFQDIENTLNPLLIKHNCKVITKDNNIILKGEYQKLKQVLINLIKNSYEAKTTDKLIIFIEAKEYKNNKYIEIIDNGIGIPKEELKKISNEYYTTKEYGTGLGIPIVKDIITSFGGYISYQSIKDRGTKVIISLPK